MWQGNWKYGIYEWNWKREYPTKEKFEGWKKDFLSIPEVKDYEVWVAGGFLEEWKSPDIDIQLWGGPKNFKVIEKLLYEGTNIGITKYNMFVDMTYQLSENKKYWNDSLLHHLKPKKRTQLMIGNELYQNNTKTWERKGIPLREGLYYTSYISPKPKQINRTYTKKPLRIK
tara:strand:- start:325 stop:837 length:513 start_codon:yes stop_codon:yes gene_type:complete